MNLVKNLGQQNVGGARLEEVKRVAEKETAAASGTH